MSASDHLQNEQLRMLIPASELRGYSVNPYDKGHEFEYHYDNHDEYPEDDSDEFLWNIKAEQAEDSGLKASIEERGVRKPVSVVHGEGAHSRHPFHSGNDKTIANGHHRVAAAAEVDPDMLVPVQHWEGNRFLRAVKDS